jgi:hypothetical protein
MIWGSLSPPFCLGVRMEPNFEGRLRSPELLSNIMAGLRTRYATLNNTHYEAGWTESFVHQRCGHDHLTLTEASKCGLGKGAAWYVFAVENGRPRELRVTEDKIVDDFRVASWKR